MKHTFPSVLVLALCTVASGASHDGFEANTRLRQEAIALLRQGKLNETKQRLDAIVPTAARATGNSVEIGQQWVLMAFHFRACGQTALARQAAAEAAALATTLAREKDVDAVRSSCVSSAGLACERILGDLSQAKSFYDAALVANPANEQARERQSAAAAKLKQRGASKAPRS